MHCAVNTANTVGLIGHNLSFYTGIRMKIAEFTNSVDPYEVAHNEQPHLELYYFIFFEFSI